MRLIDADALDFENKGICEIIDEITDAPTIELTKRNANKRSEVTHIQSTQKDIDREYSQMIRNGWKLTDVIKTDYHVFFKWEKQP